MTKLKRIFQDVQNIFSDRRLRNLSFAAGMAIIGLFLGWIMHHPDCLDCDSVVRKMQQGIEKDDLFLSSHLFETAVEIKHSDDSDTVEFVLLVPTDICCFIDTRQILYECTDSILTIRLPEPQFKKPVLHLDSIRVYPIKGNTTGGSSEDFGDLASLFSQAIKDASIQVLEEAEKSPIKDETLTKTKLFFENGFYSENLKIVTVSKD